MKKKNLKTNFFSVVIPSYNAEKTIVRTLLSCIKQSYSNFEIIIVDDASTDQTVLMMREFIKRNHKFNIKIFKQAKNSGPSVCRNIGIKESKGEYIAFLDADDFWHVDKLFVCNYWLCKLNIDLLAHSHDEKSEIQRPEARTPINYSIQNKTYLNILIKNIACTPSILIRKNILVNNLFDTSMRYTEDHELWLRISKSYKCCFINGLPLTTLGRPQLSQGGLSANRWAMRKGEIEMYVKSAKYSKLSFFLLPLLVLFSLMKFIRKELLFKIYNSN